MEAAEVGIDRQTLEKLKELLLTEDSLEAIKLRLNLPENVSIESLIERIEQEVKQLQSPENIQRLQKQIRRKRGMLVKESLLVAIQEAEYTRDTLTEAYTPQAMEARFDLAIEDLQKEKNTENVVIVISFDVDKFKHVNDTHGHEKGDEVLQKIVESFNTEFKRSSDMISRRGGDEFTIVMTVQEDSLNDMSEDDGNIKKGIISRIQDMVHTIEIDSQGKNIDISITGGVRVVHANEQISYKEAEHDADDTGTLQKIIGEGEIAISSSDLRDKIALQLATKEGRQNWAQLVTQRRHKRRLLALQATLARARQRGETKHVTSIQEDIKTLQEIIEREAKITFSDLERKARNIVDTMLS